MCGIIARVSKEKSPVKTLLGLKELEYRGYDSYGCLFYDQTTKQNLVYKDKYELPMNELDELKRIKSNIEIGHTRWATHGGISKENAHPHFDTNEDFFVVMNGIIENYASIKTELQKDGIIFSSDTDTEVIPQLYAKYFNKNNENIKEEILITTKKILSILLGEFSFILKHKNYLLIFKNVNPIIIGIKNCEVFISSDLNLVQNNSDKYQILEDNDLFIVELNDSEEIMFKHYDNNINIIERKFTKSLKQKNSIEKNTKYFMEKEILDQKKLNQIMTVNNFENIEYLVDKLRNKKVIISAAGTSYNASLYLHYILLENGILSNTILASELNNYLEVIDDSIIIVFSQSGETADLISPLKKLSSNQNNEISVITNTPNSTIDRFAKKSIHLNCGREIAVASTKAFVFQIFVGILIDKIIKKKVIKNIDNFKDIFDLFLEKNLQVIKKICVENKDKSDFFFMGRNKNYPLVLEGALKLKEISYIHAEGFAGGELKHGSLALIEEDIPVIVVGNDSEVISNAIEVKTRGGIIIGISDEKNEVYDYFLEVPSEYQDIFSTIAMQYIAFEMTLLKNLNPDKPRNLAKSVTVK